MDNIAIYQATTKQNQAGTKFRIHGMYCRYEFYKQDCLLMGG